MGGRREESLSEEIRSERKLGVRSLKKKNWTEKARKKKAYTKKETNFFLFHSSIFAKEKFLDEEIFGLTRDIVKTRRSRDDYIQKFLKLRGEDVGNRSGMRDALTIPIGMQLPARFRNDAHTGLDSQVGRNFVIKNERHRRYFSFADVSIRKIYSSLLVKKKKKNQDHRFSERLVKIYSHHSWHGYRRIFQ